MAGQVGGGPQAHMVRSGEAGGNGARGHELKSMTVMIITVIYRGIHYSPFTCAYTLTCAYISTMRKAIGLIWSTGIGLPAYGMADFACAGEFPIFDDNPDSLVTVEASKCKDDKK